MVSRKVSHNLLGAKNKYLSDFYIMNCKPIIKQYCQEVLKSKEITEEIYKALDRRIIKINHMNAWYLPTVFGATTSIPLLPYLQNPRRITGSFSREKNFMGRMTTQSTTQPVLEIFSDIQAIIQDLILLGGSNYNFVDFGLFVYLLFEYNDINVNEMLDQWEGRRRPTESKSVNDALRELDGNQIFLALKQLIMSTRIHRDILPEGAHPITFTLPDKDLAEKMIAHYNCIESKNPNRGYYGARRTFTYDEKKLRACYKILFHLFEGTYRPYRSDTSDNYKLAQVRVFQTPATEVVQKVCDMLHDDSTRDVNMFTFKWNCFKALDESPKKFREYVYSHVSPDFSQIGELAELINGDIKVKEISQRFMEKCMSNFLRSKQSSCVKRVPLRLGEDYLFWNFSISETSIDYSLIHEHCLANPRKLFEYIYLAFVINLARARKFKKVANKDQELQAIVYIENLYSEHFPRVIEIVNQVISMLQPKTDIPLRAKLIPQSTKYMTDEVRVLGDNYLLSKEEFSYKEKGENNEVKTESVEE